MEAAPARNPWISELRDDFRCSFAGREPALCEHMDDWQWQTGSSTTAAVAVMGSTAHCRMTDA